MVRRRWLRLTVGAVGAVSILIGFVLAFGESTRSISGLVVAAGVVLLLEAIFPGLLWRRRGRDK